MNELTEIWHWCLNVTGVHIAPTGSQWYNFWSGFGSDLGELVIIGVIITWYKNHKCVSCFRLSHHDVAGTHFKTCHKHFTEVDHRRLQKIHEKKFYAMHNFINKNIDK